MDGFSEKIKQTCLNKWCGSQQPDVRVQYFLDTYEDWLAQIPPETHYIMLKLLENFSYYSRKEVNKHLVALHQKLRQIPSITDENTIYTFIKNEHGVSCSSNDYWSEYKLLNNVSKYICYENISSINEAQWQCINNIVFIDDCIGTGDSLIGEINHFSETFQGKSIYFITIHAMNEGINNLKNYAKENNFTMLFINIIIKDKAFSGNMFENNDTAKDILIEISKKFKISKLDILGYKDSESLMAFYNNTPNNTLGIMRSKTKKYTPIFPREDSPKPAWYYFREKKQERHAENYNNVMRSHDNG